MACYVIAGGFEGICVIYIAAVKSVTAKSAE